jgi:pyruvate formate lyase activating enzyme
MGFLHSFTTGSAVDGPGMRVVAWTSGCMFRCVYCHNPDTWTMTNGIPVTIGRAIEELRKYREGLRVMSGGFTLSGGEALMQHRFAVKLFTAAKAMRVHTALDTNGYYGDRLSDADLQEIDLVLLDLKTWDPERHRQVTGMEVGPVLEFARRLAARKRAVWVRFVLVPGLTDDFEDIARIAAFAAGLGNVERVDVLPFHQLAASSGSASACRMRWIVPSRPPKMWFSACATCSGRRGCTPTSHNPARCRAAPQTPPRSVVGSGRRRPVRPPFLRHATWAGPC